MTGASLDELRVLVEIPQSVIEQVRAVRKAAVYVDGRRIDSTGITLFPAAQPGTNSFRARIELPKGVQGLSPGMFVKVGFVTGEADRILVPLAAVVQRSETGALRTARTTEYAVVRLNSVPNHQTSAVFTRGGQRLDRTLEAVENVSLAVLDDLDRFVVLVPAGFTTIHGGSGYLSAGVLSGMGGPRRAGTR